MRKSIVRSQINNAKTVQMYRREMLSLAENVFEFPDMPTSIDTSFVNRNLLRKGSIAFFMDDILNELLALPYNSVSSKVDVYGRPIKIEVYGRNGYRRVLNKDEFVIMYDNNGHYPIYLDIMQMSERIGLSKRVTDINITQQKTPRIWKTTEEKKKTIEDLVNEVDSCIDAVQVYDSLEVEDFDVVIAPAPYVTDKIDLHLDREWAEFYRLVGISNLTEQKRERVIKDEISVSQGGTIASRFSRFTPRKEAIEKINKKWNLNIKVRYYDNMPTTDSNDEEDEEDVSDESINNE